MVYDGRDGEAELVVGALRVVVVVLDVSEPDVVIAEGRDVVLHDPTRVGVDELDESMRRAVDDREPELTHGGRLHVQVLARDHLRVALQHVHQAVVDELHVGVDRLVGDVKGVHAGRVAGDVEAELELVVHRCVQHLVQEVDHRPGVDVRLREVRADRQASLSRVAGAAMLQVSAARRRDDAVDDVTWPVTGDGADRQEVVGRHDAFPYAVQQQLLVASQRHFRPEDRDDELEVARRRAHGAHAELEVVLVDAERRRVGVDIAHALLVDVSLGERRRSHPRVVRVLPPLHVAEIGRLRHLVADVELLVRCVRREAEVGGRDDCGGRRRQLEARVLDGSQQQRRRDDRQGAGVAHVLAVRHLQTHLLSGRAAVHVAHPAGRHVLLREGRDACAHAQTRRDLEVADVGAGLVLHGELELPGQVVGVDGRDHVAGDGHDGVGDESEHAVLEQPYGRLVVPRRHLHVQREAVRPSEHGRQRLVDAGEVQLEADAVGRRLGAVAGVTHLGARQVEQGEDGFVPAPGDVHAQLPVARRVDDGEDDGRLAQAVRGEVDEQVDVALRDERAPALAHVHVLHVHDAAHGTRRVVVAAAARAEAVLVRTHAAVVIEAFLHAHGARHARVADAREAPQTLGLQAVSEQRLPEAEQLPVHLEVLQAADE